MTLCRHSARDLIGSVSTTNENDALPDCVMQIINSRLQRDSYTNTYL